MSPDRDQLPVPAPLDARRLAPEVLEVLRTLDAAGHRSWVVGGAVRDLMLGRTRAGADVDLATPARPEQVQRLFRKVIPTGLAHGTVTVLLHGEPFEVTTFRGEGPYLDGRRPSEVTFLDDVDGDLARRDFTVNAMAWDPIGPAFRDPFGGEEDLSRRLLRAVGSPAERFAEDGLRPLRAVRFAAELGFALDPATEAAIPGALEVTARVSAERVSAELSRLLLGSSVRGALDVLERTGLLDVVLPELAELDPALRAHALAAACCAEPALPSRLAGLLHGLAADRPVVAAARATLAALTRLRFPARVAQAASDAVAVHGCLLAQGRPPQGTTPPAIRRWASAAGRGRLPAALALWRADARALPAPAREQAVAQAEAFARALAEAIEGVPLATGELALGGGEVMRLLGAGPGPVVGDALRHLLDRALDDPRLNTPARLASVLSEWRAGRPA